jgi:hypothetical protein
MNSPETNKTTRNLRALFALGFIMTLVVSIGGGLILVLGYSRASVTQPVWKFGQYVLILGSLNLAVYLGLWWQVRALQKQTGA